MHWRYGIKRHKLLYATDKQQGYIVLHKELYPLSCTNFNGVQTIKIMNHCYIPETNIIL